MSTGVERLKSEVSGLSPADRAELASFLRRTLEQEPDELADPEWDAELARRVDELRRGLVSGIPAEQVFAEIRAMYP